MPSWLWAWSSSIALGTWRSKTFPDLKHDVLVLFYYIIIIDVEMNGVLLGTIFSASLIFLKNMRCILGDVQVVYAMLLCAFRYQKDIKIVVVPQLYEPTSQEKKKSKSMRTKLTDSEKLSSTSTFMIKIFKILFRFQVTKKLLFY